MPLKFQDVQDRTDCYDDTRKDWYKPKEIWGGGWVRKSVRMKSMELGSIFINDEAVVTNNATLHKGCFVFDRAIVSGSAVLHPNTSVHDDVIIGGTAILKNSVDVEGEIEILDGVWSHPPIQVHGAIRYPIQHVGYNKYQVGCRVMPYKDWFEMYSPKSSHRSSVNKSEWPVLLKTIRWMKNNFPQPGKTE